jgi:hypothetical protein
MPEPSLEDLLARRSRLHLEIANLGDLRRGSVHVVYRKCGNPGCHCAQPGEQGHGPQLLWTRSLHGRTKTSVLDPGRLEQLQEECANYRHLRGLVHELVEVSELICEARAPRVATGGSGSVAGRAQKGGSTRASRKTSGRSGGRNS